MRNHKLNPWFGSILVNQIHGYFNSSRSKIYTVITCNPQPQATSGWLRPSAGLWLLPLGRLFAQWKGELKALSSKYHWTAESTSCFQLLSKSGPGLLWFHLGTQWCPSTHLILTVLRDTKDEHVGNLAGANITAVVPNRGHSSTLSRR